MELAHSEQKTVSRNLKWYRSWRGRWARTLLRIFYTTAGFVVIAYALYWFTFAAQAEQTGVPLRDAIRIRSYLGVTLTADYLELFQLLTGMWHLTYAVVVVVGGAFVLRSSTNQSIALAKLSARLEELGEFPSPE